MIDDPNIQHDSTGGGDDKYLYFGTGEPDPFISNLEQRLRPLRLTAPASGFAAARGGTRANRTLQIVAGMAAVALAALFLLIQKPSGPVPGPAAGGFKTPPASAPFYELTLVSGTASVDLRPHSKSGISMGLVPDRIQQFPVGGMLVVDNGGTVRVRINGSGELSNVGEVTVKGPASIELVESTAQLEKLHMYHGTMSARIAADAKPRLFQVTTPAGTAVDLGCIYEMHVDSEGAMELSVSVGRVAFEIAGRAVFVWSGSQCTARPGGHVTTPVDNGTTLAFREALQQYDLNQTRAAMDLLLKEARLHDAASLWHLIQTTRGESRSQVVARLAELSPPPAGVTIQAVTQSDVAAIEAWRVDIMGW